MKNAFLKFGAWVGVLPIVLIPTSVYATVTPGLGSAATNLGDIKSGAGLSGAAGGDFPTLIGKLISVLLGIMGIVLVFYIVLAGITYMTASGDDTKVKKAKAMIQTSVIGIIIIVAAYSISSFVIGQIIAAANT